MEKERTPLSFWLKDKTVTGLLVAEHDGKKLVAYNRRYYVVTGKTPDKRHFTDSTLPTLWRKMMISDETPPSPALPSKAAPKRSPVQAKQGAALGKPEEAPAAGGPPARAGERKKEAQPQPASPPNALPREAKQKRPRAKASKKKEAEQQTVGYFCPYCSTEHSCGVDKAGAPFFQKCSKCGKDFGVKIISKVIYLAEVAGFK